jgi:hypothetical protein
MRISFVVTLVVVCSVVLAAGSGEHSDTHEPTSTTTPAPKPDHIPTEHFPDRINRNDKSASLDVTPTDWWWVGPTVTAVFLIFYISTNRLKRLGGISFRLYIVRYFSAEPLVEGTLKGASAHVLVEQRNAEYGQQFLTLCGIVMLALDWGLNTNRDARYAVSALAAVQLVLFSFNFVADVVLLKVGFVRTVRTINTKLRFAHCIYQVVLFCTEALSTSFSMAMPVDCFVWATIHYSYEAVALAVEGLNVIGMSEFAIIVIVNARLMMATDAMTGWRCAFGITSMALSAVSLLVGLCWKVTHLNPEDRLTLEAAAAAGHHGHGTANHKESGHTSEQKLDPPHRFVASAEGDASVSLLAGPVDVSQEEHVQEDSSIPPQSEQVAANRPRRSIIRSRSSHEMLPVMSETTSIA